MAEGGGLLNRYRVSKSYRGFESLRLRQPSQNCLGYSKDWKLVLRASPPVSPAVEPEEAPKPSTKGKTISVLEAITSLAFGTPMDAKALWQYEQDHDIGVYRSEPFKMDFRSQDQNVATSGRKA